MANKKEQEEIKEQTTPTPKVTTKKVRNRSNGKVELFIDNKVVVFPPKGTVEIPYDFDVPNGIGLYVE